MLKGAVTLAGRAALRVTVKLVLPAPPLAPSVKPSPSVARAMLRFAILVPSSSTRTALAASIGEAAMLTVPMVVVAPVMVTVMVSGVSASASSACVKVISA